eukprot:m51a1_g6811 hypothetical protein (1031) ;mRNA; r:262968-267195
MVSLFENLIGGSPTLETRFPPSPGQSAFDALDRGIEALFAQGAKMWERESLAAVAEVETMASARADGLGAHAFGELSRRLALHAPPSRDVPSASRALRSLERSQCCSVLRLLARTTSGLLLAAQLLGEAPAAFAVMGPEYVCAPLLPPECEAAADRTRASVVLTVLVALDSRSGQAPGALVSALPPRRLKLLASLVGPRLRAAVDALADRQQPRAPEQRPYAMPVAPQHAAAAAAATGRGAGHRDDGRVRAKQLSTGRISPPQQQQQQRTRGVIQHSTSAPLLTVAPRQQRTYSTRALLPTPQPLLPLPVPVPAVVPSVVPTVAPLPQAPVIAQPAMGGVGLGLGLGFAAVACNANTASASCALSKFAYEWSTRTKKFSDLLRRFSAQFVHSWAAHAQAAAQGADPADWGSVALSGDAAAVEYARRFFLGVREETVELVDADWQHFARPGGAAESLTSLGSCGLWSDSASRVVRFATFVDFLGVVRGNLFAGSGSEYRDVPLPRMKLLWLEQYCQGDMRQVLNQFDCAVELRVQAGKATFRGGKIDPAVRRVEKLLHDFVDSGAFELLWRPPEQALHRAVASVSRRERVVVDVLNSLDDPRVRLRVGGPEAAVARARRSIDSPEWNVADRDPISLSSSSSLAATRTALASFTSELAADLPAVLDSRACIPGLASAGVEIVGFAYARGVVSSLAACCGARIRVATGSLSGVRAEAVFLDSSVAHARVEMPRDPMALGDVVPVGHGDLAGCKAVARFRAPAYDSEGDAESACSSIALAALMQAHAAGASSALLVVPVCPRLSPLVAMRCSRALVLSARLFFNKQSTSVKTLYFAYPPEAQYIVVASLFATVMQQMDSAWWWKSEDGSWWPYPEQQSTEIEDAFLAECDGIDINIRTEKHRIDLRAMKQVKQSSGYSRDIARRKADVEKISWNWEWAESFKWYPYGLQESKVLSDALVSGMRSVELLCTDQRYQIDFQRMTQTNLVSRFSRPIRIAPARPLEQTAVVDVVLKGEEASLRLAEQVLGSAVSIRR